MTGDAKPSVTPLTMLGAVDAEVCEDELCVIPAPDDRR
jgi:hypothetical protein